MTNQELIDLFAESLEVDSASLSLDTKIEDVEEWNSLAWLTIISLLDERYNVTLSAQEIRKFKSVNDVIDGITARVTASGNKP